MGHSERSAFHELLQIDALCQRFERRVRAGEQPQIESFLVGWENEHRARLFRHLAEIEVEYGPNAETESRLAHRFPEYADIVSSICESDARRTPSTWLTGAAAECQTDDHLPDVIGDYAVKREIGRGGMGVVYEAEQQSLNRRVALKILPQHVLQNANAMDRFRLEARLAAKLHHTNIVPVYEVGQDGETCYYAMQYIEGISLDQLPSQSPPEVVNGSFFKQVADIGQQAADALEYAHCHGVIHRDIKPANLLRDDTGVVWITDFGLAKGDDVELTRSGDFMGTLRYVSPERLHGECDERSDIYALGATLYELLTRHHLFQTNDRVELLRMIAEEDPRRPRSIDASIPRDLETIVLKALSKSPRDRYSTAGDLSEDLRRFARDEPITARQLMPWERLERWCRRNPGMATLNVAVAALLVAIAVISVQSAIEQDRLASIAQDQQRFAEDRLIDVHTANGQRLVEQDRLAAALPWLAEAVRLDERRASQGAAPLNPIHRIRLATALRPCPKMSQAWIDTKGFNQATFNPDASLVALACADNSAHLIKPATGELACDPLEHEAEVVSIAFSPDGRFIATGCKDGTVSFWEINSGQRVGVMRDHEGAVVALSVNSDGITVASASEDSTARIWRPPLPIVAQNADRSNRGADDDAAPCVSLVHDGQVRSVQFSRDGKQLLTASHDGFTRLWDVDSGDETLRIQHQKAVEFASFAHEDRNILTASRDFTASVWDREGNPVCPPLRHRGVVNHIAMSPDGMTIATASEDHTARLWHMPSGQPKNLALRHNGIVNIVCFSADGRYVLTGSDDFSVVVWDVNTGLQAMPALPHNGEVIAAEFSDDGRRILSASYGRIAGLWEIAAAEPERTILRHDAIVSYAEFDCTGERILTASRDKSVRLWSVSTREPVAPSLEHRFPVLHATFNADSSRVVTASGANDHGELRLWNAFNGDLLWTLESNNAFEYCTFNDASSHVAATTDRRVLLVDLASPSSNRSFKHDDRVSSVAFSPDGTSLVTSSFDKTACVWDTATGSLSFRRLPHENRVDFACFSPDGSSILTTSSGEGELSVSRLWDSKTGDLITSFWNHRSWYVLHADFHPSGNRVCCAGSVTAINWDLKSGAETASGLRHRGMIAQVRFSSDGRFLATASWDNTARVWDAVTGQPVSPPVKHHDWVMSVNFSPDCSHLVTASKDGTSRVVDLRTIYGSEDDLVRISELLSAERIDKNGGTARLAHDEFEIRRRTVQHALRSLIYGSDSPRAPTRSTRSNSL